MALVLEAVGSNLNVQERKCLEITDIIAERWIHGED